MTACFGLPPRVNDGAPPAADHVIVPVPSFGVDRFAHGAKDAQDRQIAFFDISVPCAISARMAVGAV